MQCGDVQRAWPDVHCSPYKEGRRVLGRPRGQPQRPSHAFSFAWYHRMVQA